jgi:ribosomal protein S18 acetylase RimI-like enzyme
VNSLNELFLPAKHTVASVYMSHDVDVSFVVVNNDGLTKGRWYELVSSNCRCTFNHFSLKRWMRYTNTTYFSTINIVCGKAPVRMYRAHYHYQYFIILEKVLLTHRYPVRDPIGNLRNHRRKQKMTTGKTTIYQATLDHLSDLVPLFDAYRQFYKQPSDKAGARIFLENRLTHGESVIFLAYNLKDVAGVETNSAVTDTILDDEQQHVPVGFIQLYPSFSSVSMQRVWILNDLYVTPTARDTGVASALMHHAETFGQGTGAKGLVLETAVDNHVAQRLYERRNWKRDTESYVYTWKNPDDSSINTPNQSKPSSER